MSADSARTGIASESVWPLSDSDVSDWTDKYFRRTKEAVERFGDARVTYAVFMRRPVISAPRLAIEWLQAVAIERNTSLNIDLR